MVEIGNLELAGYEYSAKLHFGIAEAYSGEISKTRLMHMNTNIYLYHFLILLEC